MQEPGLQAVNRSPEYGERLRLGMILASKNTVAEPDAYALLPPGVSIHTTRLLLLGTAAEELSGMTQNAEQAAGLLASAGVDLIVFHCTAASTVDADMGEKLAGRIERSTGIPATATSQALVAALNTLEARRIVMLTPYPQAVNDAEVSFFAHHGIAVIQEAGFLPRDERGSPGADPQDWFQRTLALKRPDADAYLLSCTNIRAISVIGPLEQELQKPVLSSNQAMIWHCLRKGHITDAVHGYGSLLSAH